MDSFSLQQSVSHGELGELFSLTTLEVLGKWCLSTKAQILEGMWNQIFAMLSKPNFLPGLPLLYKVKHYQHY